MEKETKMQAYKRLMKGKATKSELKVLIKWAETEINEWEVFLKLCNKQLKNLN
jgi:hypothetical protein